MDQAAQKLLNLFCLFLFVERYYDVVNLTRSNKIVCLSAKPCQIREQRHLQVIMLFMLITF